MRRCLAVGLLGMLGAAGGTGAYGQIASATTGPNYHVWAGAEYANFRPDWGLSRLPGLTIFADVPFYNRVGLEGEARFLTFTKPDGLTEKSYLGGLFGRVITYHHTTFNVKFMLGAGLVNYTSGIGYGSYFDYAPGGDVEYRFSHRWKARVDYEYQFLPSAPNLGPGYPNHGLTPSGFSGGLAYEIK